MLYFIKFLSDEDDNAALFTLNVDMNLYQSRQKSGPGWSVIFLNFCSFGYKTNDGHFCFQTDQVVVSGWDCLKLEYSVQWPLHILFQEPILDK